MGPLNHGVRLWGLVGVLAAMIWAGAALPLAAKAELPPIIPREILFGNPVRVAPQLSWDGTRLAYLAPDEGVLNVWVRTVGKEDDRVLTHDRGQGIRAFFWAPNDEQIIYIQDKDGDENWHIYTVPYAGGDAVDMTPIDGVQARIFAVDRDHPDEILVGINDRIPQLHDAYRLNLRTGERKLEAQNDMGAVGWIADHDLQIRVAEIPTPDGGFALLHRPSPDAEWAELISWGYEDALGTGAVAFAADNQTLYMISSVDANTAELRTYDVKTGEEKVLASDDTYDVSGLFMHPKTHEIQAVGFTKERREWKVLDPSVEKHFEALKKFNRGDFGVVDRDYDDKTWLIGYTQDKGPVLYYSYNKETSQGTFMFSHQPELEDLTLAEMKPVSFTSRDGLTIHGYLSLPVGVEAKNLPAVVLIHGGPWSRDRWGFNPEPQWLANRGYACLQINFRGSTGYGKKFVNAGDREWGGKVQNDITDGTKWLIEEGIADPDRVAIYGGSFGGYATLCGVTMTPDLYACGVDMVGPANLVTWMKTIPPYWEPLKPLFYTRIGNPETEVEFLKSRSPFFMVDKIQVPLLIAQGANDPRVPREESIQIKEALEAAGKTVHYMEFEDEGHGFARPENRLEFYAAMEKFLAEHLGGRFEPAPEEGGTGTGGASDTAK
jgi:dipeptidyl aminopeptidase/acylaminoacyl peptidase